MAKDVALVKKHVEKMKGRYIKLATLGVAFMGLVIVGAGALLTYWSYSGTDVLQVNNAPFPVRINGEVIIMEVDYCKNMAVHGSVRMSFVSATSEVFLPMGREDSPKGCVKNEFPILIPKLLPPDRYRVKFRVVYDINPIKKGEVKEFESQEFVVK